MKTGVVKEFKDDYAFLSNFYQADFMWRNQVWPSAEHAFQAAKGYCLENSYLKDIVKHEEACRTAADPGKAKAIGRKVNLDVDNWNMRRVSYMREIVHAKFTNNLSDFDMVGSLINTGAAMLVEGNDWDDRFWGRCNGRGLNILGAILMEERGYWLKGDFNEG